jgi:hypothetical protein
MAMFIYRKNNPTKENKTFKVSKTLSEFQSNKKTVFSHFQVFYFTNMASEVSSIAALCASASTNRHSSSDTSVNKNESENKQRSEDMKNDARKKNSVVA